MQQLSWADVLYAIGRTFTDHQVVESAEGLKKSLLVRGKELETYSSDDNVLLAYFTLYFPSLFEKAFQFFLKHPFLVGPHVESVVDFGSGPGTMGLAWLMAKKSLHGERTMKSCKVFCVEKSSKMIAFHQRIANRCKISHFSWNRIPSAVDLNLFGHSLNELSLKESWDVLAKHSSELIVWMEPGTRACFEQALHWRAHLLGQGYECLYPCMASSDCPWEGSPDEWCHQFHYVSLPEESARLCQRAGLNRHLLASVDHIFAKKEGLFTGPANKVEKQKARLVRNRGVNKSSWTGQMCLDVDGDNAVIRFELLLRDYSSEQKKRFARLKAGEQLLFTVVKKLGQNFWRIKI